MYNERLAPSSFFTYFNTWVLAHLPEVRLCPPSLRDHSDTAMFQITFAIRAMRNPERLPEFMARLQLVQTSARNVAWSVNGVLNNGDMIRGNLDVLRRTYEAENIRNVVPDGTVPFQIELPQETSGVALEFRYVVCVAYAFKAHCLEET